jgi:hypothetical protein
MQLAAAALDSAARERPEEEPEATESASADDTSF